MLHYRIYRRGDDAEWVVFVHGFGGSSSIWCRQIHSFSREFNLLLVDLRGHGASAAVKPYSARYSYDDIARDVLEVLDAIGLRSCHFIGVSMGTIVVRKVAEMDIARVRSLGMAGAVVKFNLRSEFLIRLALLVQHFIPYMWIYRLYSKILMPKKRHRTARRLFVSEAMKMKRREFIRWFSLADRLGSLLGLFRAVELPVPTLYLMGEDDSMFLPQVRALVKVHTRHSSLVVVPGSGHVCNVDNAPFFNETALHFLRTACCGD